MQSINQINSILQSLSDQQLQQEMKHPQAGVPQFLIMSEMQRRQKLRTEAKPPAPGTSSTVVDDTMSQGVAGLPGMAGGDAPGGIASFAGGGAVEHYDDGGATNGDKWWQYGPTSSYPSGGPPNVPEDSPLMKAWRKINGIFSDDKTPVGQKIANSLPSSAAGAFSGLPDSIKGIDAEVGRAQQSIPDLTKMPGAIDKYVGDTQRFNLDRWDQAGIKPIKIGGGNKPAVTNALGAAPQYAVPDIPVAQDDQPVAGGGTGGRSRGVGPGVGSGAGVPAVGAALGVTPPNAPDAKSYDQIPLVQQRKIADYMDQVNQNMPDSTDEIVARNDDRMSKLDKEKANQVNMALMQAGLGIMAAGGRNGSFLGSVGEGGIGGLKAYTEGMSGINARADRLGQQRDSMMLARDAAKAGRFKTASDLAKQDESFDLNQRNQQVKERHHDQDYDQKNRHADMQQELGREQISKSLDIARMTNDAHIQAARIAASARGIGAVGSDAKTAKAATSMFNSLSRSLQKANPPGFNEDAGAYTKRIYALALSQMSPEYRHAMGGVLDTSAMSAPAQNTRIIGSDGNWAK